MKPTLIYLGLCLPIVASLGACHSIEAPSPALIEVSEISDPNLKLEDTGAMNDAGRIGKLTSADLVTLADAEDRIDLQLFDGEIATARLDRIRKIGHQGMSWFGHIENDPKGYLSVTYFNGSAVGSVRINGQRYELSNHPDGSILLKEVMAEETFHCETEEVSQ